MNPHRRLLLVFSAAMLAAVVASWLIWPHTRIKRENFERLEAGMTLAEVEEILGGPPRDDSTGRPQETINFIVSVPLAGKRVASEVAELRNQAPKGWTSDTVCVYLYFDPEDRLIDGQAALRPAPVPEGPLAILRRWLRW